MYELLQTLYNRFEKIYMKSAEVVEWAPKGSTILKVSDMAPFAFWHAMRHKIYATIYKINIISPAPDNTYTEAEIIERVRIKSADLQTQTIELTAPLQNDVEQGFRIKRTPHWLEVNGLFLGDPETINTAHLPAICIVPESHDFSYLTLMGTKEPLNVNIVIHFIDSSHPDTVLGKTILATEVKEILDGDIHIKIEGRPDPTQRPYMVITRGIQFGYSYKGQFLQSAKIPLTVEEYWHRTFLQESGVNPFEC